MSKLILNILFSSLLIFQTTAMAEDENTSIETHAEEQDINTTEEATPSEQIKREASEPKDSLSEAQKEALAAEEAELREAGIYDEEPIEE